MNPYESGAVIDMNMGHNSTTPAPTGADALRVAAQAALTALENLHEIDTECITIDVQDEIDALRAALASAAQIQEQGQAIAATHEACAQACERIASLKWDAYKGLSEDHPTNPDRGNPHTEGMADGAELCAQAIRVLANTVQPPPLQTKTNQCGETCERAKLCAICARGLEDPADEALTAEQIEALKADSDRLEWLFRPQREEGWMWHNLHRVGLHEHKYFSRASDVRLVTHESFREAIDTTRAVKLPPKKPKPTIYFGSGGVTLRVGTDDTCTFSYHVGGGGMHDKFLYSMVDDGYKPYFDALLEKHNLRLSDEPIMFGHPPRLTDRVVKKEIE